MKVKQRELHYPCEGYDATDFGETGYNGFWVFLVGVNKVRVKDEIRL